MAPQSGTRSASQGGAPGNFRRETLPKDASRTMHSSGPDLSQWSNPARAEWSERHQHQPIFTISVSVDQAENKKDIIRSFLRSTRAALSRPHFAPGWVARGFSFTAITYGSKLRFVPGNLIFSRADP